MDSKVASLHSATPAAVGSSQQAGAPTTLEPPSYSGAVTPAGFSTTLPRHVAAQLRWAADNVQGSCPMFPYQHGFHSWDNNADLEITRFLSHAMAPNPFLNVAQKLTEAQQSRLHAVSTVSQGPLGLTTHTDAPRLPQVRKPFKAERTRLRPPAKVALINQRLEEEESAPLVRRWFSNQPTDRLREFEHKNLAYVVTPQKPVIPELSNVVLVQPMLGLLHVRDEAGQRALSELLVDFGSIESHQWVDGASPYESCVRVVFQSSAAVEQLLAKCSYTSEHGFVLKSCVGSRSVSLRIWPYWQSLSTWRRYETFPEEVIFEEPCFVLGLTVPLTGEQLAAPFDCLFGPVLYAKVFLDQLGFPMNEGFVVFRERAHHAAALRAGQIVLNARNVRLTLTTVPEFDHELCSHCLASVGRVFCRHSQCTTFFCNACFLKVHDSRSLLRQLEDPLLEAVQESHRVHVFSTDKKTDDGQAPDA